MRFVKPVDLRGNAIILYYVGQTFWSTRFASVITVPKAPGSSTLVKSKETILEFLFSDSESAGLGTAVRDRIIWHLSETQNIHKGNTLLARAMRTFVGPHALGASIRFGEILQAGPSILYYILNPPPRSMTNNCVRHTRDLKTTRGNQSVQLVMCSFSSNTPARCAAPHTFDHSENCAKCLNQTCDYF